MLERPFPFAPRAFKWDGLASQTIVFSEFTKELQNLSIRFKHVRPAGCAHEHRHTCYTPTTFFVFQFIVSKVDEGEILEVEIVEVQGRRRGRGCCSAHMYGMQGSLAAAKASR